MTHANWIVRRIAEILQASGDADLVDLSPSMEEMPIFQQMELVEAMAADLSLMCADDIVKILQYARRLAPSVQARMLAMLFEVEPPNLPLSRHLILKHSPAIVEIILMQDNVRNTIASYKIFLPGRASKDALQKGSGARPTKTPLSHKR